MLGKTGIKYRLYFLYFWQAGFRPSKAVVGWVLELSYLWRNLKRLCWKPNRSKRINKTKACALIRPGHISITVSQAKRAVIETTKETANKTAIKAINKNKKNQSKQQ
ncbi:MAG TPA: hypothetical protein DER02_14185 [Gammaproteobacteria bacterium]|nr:hypothetical protein [Gammaproteobacteria bacterium]